MFYCFNRVFKTQTSEAKSLSNWWQFLLETDSKWQLRRQYCYQWSLSEDSEHNPRINDMQCLKRRTYFVTNRSKNNNTECFKNVRHWSAGRLIFVTRSQTKPNEAKCMFRCKWLGPMNGYEWSGLWVGFVCCAITVRLCQPLSAQA